MYVEFLVKQWHKARNLVHGSTDKDQCLKLMQEVGELSDSICKGNILINIAERNGLSLEECLKHSYEEIKDRKGTMMYGVFIKEEDNNE
jgi:hypothetical protein